MVLKVCRQMIHSAVEIVDSRQQLTKELLAGALAVIRSLAVDTPLVIQEVGSFAPKLLEQGVFGACLRRSCRVVRSLDVGHRYSARAGDGAGRSPRSRGPYGSGTCSTDGRRWAVCGYGAMSS
jgi:hypothetical protein